MDFHHHHHAAYYQDLEAAKRKRTEEQKEKETQEQEEQQKEAEDEEQKQTTKKAKKVATSAGSGAKKEDLQVVLERENDEAIDNFFNDKKSELKEDLTLSEADRSAQLKSLSETRDRMRTFLKLYTYSEITPKAGTVFNSFYYAFANQVFRSRSDFLKALGPLPPNYKARNLALSGFQPEKPTASPTEKRLEDEALRSQMLYLSNIFQAAVYKILVQHDEYSETHNDMSGFVPDITIEMRTKHPAANTEVISYTRFPRELTEGWDYKYIWSANRPFHPGKIAGGFEKYEEGNIEKIAASDGKSDPLADKAGISKEDEEVATFLGKLWIRSKAQKAGHFVIDGVKNLGKIPGISHVLSAVGNDPTVQGLAATLDTTARAARAGITVAKSAFQVVSDVPAEISKQLGMEKKPFVVFGANKQKRVIVIAVRGTSPKSDWSTNADSFPIIFATPTGVKNLQQKIRDQNAVEQEARALWHVKEYQKKLTGLTSKREFRTENLPGAKKIIIDNRYAPPYIPPDTPEQDIDINHLLESFPELLGSGEDPLLSYDSWINAAGAFHGGFLLKASELLVTLYQYLARLCREEGQAGRSSRLQGWNIVVTGHSLGGALSSLIGIALATITELEARVFCNTFASPPVMVENQALFYALYKRGHRFDAYGFFDDLVTIAKVPIPRFVTDFVSHRFVPFGTTHTILPPFENITVINYETYSRILGLLKEREKIGVLISNGILYDHEAREVFYEVLKEENEKAKPFAARIWDLLVAIAKLVRRPKTSTSIQQGAVEIGAKFKELANHIEKSTIALYQTARKDVLIVGGSTLALFISVLSHKIATLFLRIFVPDAAELELPPIAPEKVYNFTYQKSLGFSRLGTIGAITEVIVGVTLSFAGVVPVGSTAAVGSIIYGLWNVLLSLKESYAPMILQSFDYITEVHSTDRYFVEIIRAINKKREGTRSVANDALSTALENFQPFKESTTDKYRWLYYYRLIKMKNIAITSRQFYEQGDLRDAMLVIKGGKSPRGVKISGTKRMALNRAKAVIGNLSESMNDAAFHRIIDIVNHYPTRGNEMGTIRTLILRYMDADYFDPPLTVADRHAVLQSYTVAAHLSISDKLSESSSSSASSSRQKKKRVFYLNRVQSPYLEILATILDAPDLDPFQVNLKQYGGQVEQFRRALGRWFQENLFSDGYISDEARAELVGKVRSLRSSGSTELLSSGELSPDRFRPRREFSDFAIEGIEDMVAPEPFGLARTPSVAAILPPPASSKSTRRTDTSSSSSSTELMAYLPETSETPEFTQTAQEIIDFFMLGKDFQRNAVLLRHVLSLSNFISLDDEDTWPLDAFNYRQGQGLTVAPSRCGIWDLAKIEKYLGNGDYGIAMKAHLDMKRVESIRNSIGNNDAFAGLPTTVVLKFAFAEDLRDVMSTGAELLIHDYLMRFDLAKDQRVPNYLWPSHIIGLYDWDFCEFDMKKLFQVKNLDNVMTDVGESIGPLNAHLYSTTTAATSPRRPTRKVRQNAEETRIAKARAVEYAANKKARAEKILAKYLEMDAAKSTKGPTPQRIFLLEFADGDMAGMSKENPEFFKNWESGPAPMLMIQVLSTLVMLQKQISFTHYDFYTPNVFYLRDASSFFKVFEKTLPEGRNVESIYGGFEYVINQDTRYVLPINMPVAKIADFGMSSCQYPANPVEYFQDRNSIDNSAIDKQQQQKGFVEINAGFTISPRTEPELKLVVNKKTRKPTPRIVKLPGEEDKNAPVLRKGFNPYADSHRIACDMLNTCLDLVMEGVLPGDKENPAKPVPIGAELPNQKVTTVAEITPDANSDASASYWQNVSKVLDSVKEQVEAIPEKQLKNLASQIQQESEDLNASTTAGKLALRDVDVRFLRLMDLMIFREWTDNELYDKAAQVHKWLMDVIEVLSKIKVPAAEDVDRRTYEANLDTLSRREFVEKINDHVLSLFKEVPSKHASFPRKTYYPTYLESKDPQTISNTPESVLSNAHSILRPFFQPRVQPETPGLFKIIDLTI